MTRNVTNLTPVSYVMYILSHYNKTTSLRVLNTSEIHVDSILSNNYCSKSAAVNKYCLISKPTMNTRQQDKRNKQQKTMLTYTGLSIIIMCKGLIVQVLACSWEQDLYSSGILYFVGTEYYCVFRF